MMHKKINKIIENLTFFDIYPLRWVQEKQKLLRPG